MDEVVAQINNVKSMNEKSKASNDLM